MQLQHDFELIQSKIESMHILFEILIINIYICM